MSIKVQFYEHAKVYHVFSFALRSVSLRINYLYAICHPNHGKWLKNQKKRDVVVVNRNENKQILMWCNAKHEESI